MSPLTVSDSDTLIETEESADSEPCPVAKIAVFEELISAFSAFIVILPVRALTAASSAPVFPSSTVIDNSDSAF